MTHAWFFGRLVPMLLSELTDALHHHFAYDDVTAEEQADLSGLATLLQSAAQLSTRIALRGTPSVGIDSSPERVLCVCGHRRRVHESASPHACQGAKGDTRLPTRCECKSFTAAEPAYERPTDRPPPPPKEGDPEP